ncbi:MAG: ADP-glyceromanno-heptose 6-epimerase [bacterium]|nr:ADP-glyceromanno-heptose 6-epimerase [bacterium]MDZ4296380.1 ADP-glyceromanno-heptose 6-epimerase [Patescibacteria group bacterium]
MAKKLVITGGAGFIGSNVIRALNREGRDDLIVVDCLGDAPADRIKRQYLGRLCFESYYDRTVFTTLLRADLLDNIEAIIHLGASTDTMERDRETMLDNNTRYSQTLLDYCARRGTRFIYASSAAVYGDGTRGYRESERDLKPLNYYGESKYLFDQWALARSAKPVQWAGLRFFNVYGPNEAHKGPMASRIRHGYEQIQREGGIRLFQSHRGDVADGEQKRDFIYVDDVVAVVLFFLAHPDRHGIFNVGTGRARSFLDLAHTLFAALERPPRVEFIPMPEEIRGKYQYFTEADMTALRSAGYDKPFHSLEDGVGRYVERLVRN